MEHEKELLIEALRTILRFATSSEFRTDNIRAIESVCRETLEQVT